MSSSMRPGVSDQRELLMSIKEISTVLNVSPASIKRAIKKLFPECLKNGKKALLTEAQATEIKKLLSTHHNLLSTEQLQNVYTDLEMEELSLKVILYHKEKIEKLKKEIRQMQPKALVYDKIVNSEGLKTVQEVAKNIGIGPNILFSLLRDKGIFYRTNGINLPKQEYIESGYFVTREEPYQINNKDHVYTRIYLTGKGEVWLTKLVHAFNEIDEFDKGS